MSTQFKLRIPDEPFKDTYELEKTLNITYTGPRYMVLSVFTDTQQVSTYETLEDNLEDINLSDFASDDTTFYVVDCYNHLLEASFITHQYTHNDYDNYREELPTGEIYEYLYDNHILSNIYNFTMPTYNHSTQEFGSLELLKPVTTNEEFWERLDSKILELSKDPKIGVHDDADQELNDYLETLKQLKIDYLDVDYWKIPYPSAPA